jgi:hypothetical protein
MDKLREYGVEDIHAYPGPEVPLNEDTVVLYMFHSIQYARSMPRPRLIKSHLPISALPKDVLKKCKVCRVTFVHSEEISDLRPVLKVLYFFLVSGPLCLSSSSALHFFQLFF